MIGKDGPQASTNKGIHGVAVMNTCRTPTVIQKQKKLSIIQEVPFDWNLTAGC
jgi:hypothetical protein